MSVHWISQSIHRSTATHPPVSSPLHPPFTTRHPIAWSPTSLLPAQLLSAVQDNNWSHYGVQTCRTPPKVAHRQRGSTELKLKDEWLQWQQRYLQQTWALKHVPSSLGHTPRNRLANTLTPFVLTTSTYTVVSSSCISTPPPHTAFITARVLLSRNVPRSVRVVQSQSPHGLRCYDLITVVSSTHH